jgi:hypothetical protein
VTDHQSAQITELREMLKTVTAKLVDAADYLELLGYTQPRFRYRIPIDRANRLIKETEP